MAGVKVTGTVPDIREFIWSAWVYVSPLRFGAGIKNKILEAMALGAPIVATPPSLTGTLLKDGQEVLVARHPAEIAEAVLRLLGDEGLCRSLSLEARRRVETEYSWPRIAGEFEALWRLQ
jgi:glycosyltransferase involved in cell wall biosynthesis